MTISDEPDEDADNLEDDDLVEGALGISPTTPAAKAAAGTTLPDWPGCGLTTRSLTLDPATIEWFQDNHVDWSGEIQAVLRAWVQAHKTGAPPAG